MSCRVPGQEDHERSASRLTTTLQRRRSILPNSSLIPATILSMGENEEKKELPTSRDMWNFPQNDPYGVSRELFPLGDAIWRREGVPRMRPSDIARRTATGMNTDNPCEQGDDQILKQLRNSWIMEGLFLTWPKIIFRYSYSIEKGYKPTGRWHCSREPGKQWSTSFGEQLVLVRPDSSWIAVEVVPSMSMLAPIAVQLGSMDMKGMTLSYSMILEANRIYDSSFCSDYSIDTPSRFRLREDSWSGAQRRFTLPVTPLRVNGILVSTAHHFGDVWNRVSWSVDRYTMTSMRQKEERARVEAIWSSTI